MTCHHLLPLVGITLSIGAAACGGQTVQSGSRGVTGPDLGGPMSGPMSGFVRRADFAQTPLEGATVQILDGPRTGAVAITDATGAYQISDVPAGKIQVRASKSGYEGDPGDPEELSEEGHWFFTFNPSHSMNFSLSPLQPIAIGEVVSATTSSDGTATVCVDDLFGKQYPCQRYILDATVNGVLTVRLTWNTAQMGLWIVLQSVVGGLRASPLGPSPLTASSPVKAGHRYHVEIWDASAGHTFELTTTLE